MNLNKHLFWDSDTSQIDYEKKARQIIERVVTRGKLEDWHEVRKYYGLDRIKKEVLRIRFLDELTLNFLSWFFKIPKTDFRCYTSDPSIQKLWNY